MKIAVLLLALASVAVAAPRRHKHAGPHRAAEEKASAPDMNIPELAEKLGATTLVELVKKTGLADALSGTGPFTVFGPVNEAFEHLPPGVGDNITVVKGILMFHVISGDVYSSQLKNDLMAPSLLTSFNIRINLYAHGGHTVATAEGSRIILADQNATNGVIHVVNRVLIPPIWGTIPNFFSSQYGKGFSTLVTAVEAAGLVDTLSGAGPFTLFAPTDEAFDKIPKQTLDNLLKNKTQLTKVLTFHVVASTQWSAGLYNQESVPTVEGQSLTVEISGEPGHRPEIDIGFGTGRRARVVYPDVSATNGVIHAIDTVMLPSDL